MVPGRSPALPAAGELAGTHERAGEVDGEDALELGGLEGEHGGVREDTGVVDEDVGVGTGEQLGDRGLVGDVDTGRLGVATDPLGRVAGCVGAAVDHHDGGAVLGQAPGDGEPEPLGGAGDDGAPAAQVETLVHWPTLTHRDTCTRLPVRQ